MFGNKTEEEDAIDILLQNIEFYYAPILIYLGSLGNCLSICVFLCTKLRYSSCNIYLIALVVSDTGYLMVVFVEWLKMVDINLHHHSCFCKFFTYLSYLCSFLSAWFVVAFTVERFMAIKYPLRCHSICTVARAKMVIIGLLGLGLLLCSPMLLFTASNVLSNAKRNVTGCDIVKEWECWATVYNIIDTVLTFLMPFIIIVILNALIAQNIYKFSRIRRTLTIESHVSNGKDIYAPNLQSRSSQTKITKMLLIVSTVFLCLYLPSYVMRMFAYFQKNQSRTLVLAQKMCQLLFYTNFGINFILYCASGQNFRKAMKHMFKCRSRQRNKTFIQMTTHEKQYSSQLPRKSSSTKQTNVIDSTQ